MALGGRAEILLRAVLHIQQPLGEAVMEEHQRTGARYRYHAAQLMKPAIKILDGDADAGCSHALVQDLLGDG